MPLTTVNSLLILSVALQIFFWKYFDLVQNWIKCKAVNKLNISIYINSRTVIQATPYMGAASMWRFVYSANRSKLGREVNTTWGKVTFEPGGAWMNHLQSTASDFRASLSFSTIADSMMPSDPLISKSQAVIYFMSQSHSLLCDTLAVLRKSRLTYFAVLEEFPCF